MGEAISELRDGQKHKDMYDEVSTQNNEEEE
jgi:hypothetical protein